MKRTRRPTAEQLAAAEAEAGLLRLALQCLANEEDALIERFTDHDHGRWALRLFRPTSPTGGVLVVAWAPADVKQQRPSVDAHYFDEYRRLVTRMASLAAAPNWKLMAAVDRLAAARQRAYDAEREEKAR